MLEIRWRAVRCDDKGDELIIAVVDDCGINIINNILKERLDALRFYAVPPDFNLRIETPQKLNLSCTRINTAAIASAVQAAIVWVLNKSLSCSLRLITVAFGEMATPNTKLSDFTPGQSLVFIRFDNDVIDPRER